jgi:hypothetical protein
VEGREVLSGEVETGRLDDILMGDDDHIAVGMLLIERSGHGGGALGHIGELLLDEVQSLRVVEVGLQLAGEA